MNCPNAGNKANREDSHALENQAREILIDSEILKVSQECPYCGRFAVRSLRRDRYRCRECGKEWGLKRGSILEKTRISYKTFLSLVRLYAEDVVVNEAATQLGISKNTTYDMYSRIRTTITSNNYLVLIDHSQNHAGNNNTQPTNSSGSLLNTKIPDQAIVFGIRLQNGKVVIEQVGDPDPEVIMALPVPFMQRGNIIFIDAYGKKYQGFITYNPVRQGREIVRIQPRDGLSWSPLTEFWTFTGKSWARHRGVDRKNIPEFVQELVFRFNHRHTDIFPVILQKIAQTEYSDDPVL